MVNSVKGDTPLKLADGREYKLVLDMEALLSVEDATGLPLPRVMARAQEGFMSAVAAIAQAAFHTHHPDVSRAEVLEIQRTEGPALEKALAQAVERAYPKEEGGNAPQPKGRPKAKRRASKSSGRNGAKQG